MYRCTSKISSELMSACHPGDVLSVHYFVPLHIIFYHNHSIKTNINYFTNKQAPMAYHWHAGQASTDHIHNP